MTVLFPPTKLDCYKFGHNVQYPEGTEFVYENMTARGSRIPGVDKVVVFGLQSYLEDLNDSWNRGFFALPLQEVLDKWNRRKDGMLGPNNIGDEHIAALHDLGYLPLQFNAIPEGMEVPLRVPMFTVENTVAKFGWLVGLLETNFQNNTWHAMTSATTALRFRRLLDRYAAETSDIPEFVDWQGHDFSYRGLTSDEQAAKSGAAHLLSFAGTDTVPALDFIEQNYGPTQRFLGGSVAATEHSVMCSVGVEGEFDLYRRLITEVYPEGIVSIVSDTNDFWKVVTEYLPALKDEIMARPGPMSKVVIRPDSGDPADILCGKRLNKQRRLHDDWCRCDGRGVVPGPNGSAIPCPETEFVAPEETPEEKGLIQCLYEIFGGTRNSKGYIQLDPHIGAIYGDSITYDRGDDILRRLKAKGFASTNVVFGVGSFTYQYVTRDTFGFAEKATHITIDGVGRDISKGVKTDSGTKKSALGRLAVFPDENGVPRLKEQATWEDEHSIHNLLIPVFMDGEFLKRYTWDEIVDRVGVRVLR
jgi:nicotinamide phosphoribosyltransferase